MPQFTALHALERVCDKPKVRGFPIECRSHQATEWKKLLARERGRSFVIEIHALPCDSLRVLDLQGATSRN